MVWKQEAAPVLQRGHIEVRISSLYNNPPHSNVTAILYVGISSTIM